MRRILVTGANKGIGLAIASAILEQHVDTMVVLGSRNLERGQGAFNSLVGEHPEWASRIEVLELDVSRDASVEQAASQLEAFSVDDRAPLYAIVNNAGIGFGMADLRGVLGVNVFGMHRVCQAFLPLLDISLGRIVNITSAAGPNFVAACSPALRAFLTDVNIEWSSLQSLMEECLAGGNRDPDAAKLAHNNIYGFSKACANSYTLCLARENPQLRINACTPGWIETDLTRHHSETTGKSAADLGMKPPAEGTRSALYLLFEELEGNGRYYGSDAVRSPLDSYRAPGDPPFTGD
jgi:NAD(P)-dependent dehydrogenase (short-subunit alcohol dehydrogenase family)